MAEQTEIIKRSIHHRAKYRVGKKKKYCPGLVVPHPAILGVNVVGPRRLRLLAGTLVYEGYDSIAADLNCVSVQEKPLPSGGAGNSFQVAFSSSLKADHDIAEFGPGETIAIAGSLSNADLNCALRNVFA